MKTPKNWQRDDRRNIDTYTKAQHAFGLDHRSLCWGSAEGQQLRFAVLTEPLIGAATQPSLLDVGCGQGDLLRWFRKQRIKVRYTGLDLTPAMIATCQKRFPDERWTLGSLLDPETKLAKSYDHVVASGIFTYRQHRPYQYVEATLSRMFALAKQSIAFNILSSWANEPRKGDFTPDPLRILKICHSLTSRLTFRHDYHRRDMTFHLYK